MTLFELGFAWIFTCLIVCGENCVGFAESVKNFAGGFCRADFYCVG